jgi:hypothetical protein
VCGGKGREEGGEVSVAAESALQDASRNSVKVLPWARRESRHYFSRNPGRGSRGETPRMSSSAAPAFPGPEWTRTAFVVLRPLPMASAPEKRAGVWRRRRVKKRAECDVMVGLRRVASLPSSAIPPNANYPNVGESIVPHGKTVSPSLLHESSSLLRMMTPTFGQSLPGTSRPATIRPCHPKICWVRGFTFFPAFSSSGALF